MFVVGAGPTNLKRFLKYGLFRLNSAYLNASDVYLC